MLNRSDLVEALFQRGGHCLVHRLRVGAFHQVGRLAIPPEEFFQLPLTDAGKHRWVVDFVSIQVEDWQARRHRESG